MSGGEQPQRGPRRRKPGAQRKKAAQRSAKEEPRARSSDARAGEPRAKRSRRRRRRGASQAEGEPRSSRSSAADAGAKPERTGSGGAKGAKKRGRRRGRGARSGATAQPERSGAGKRGSRSSKQAGRRRVRKPSKLLVPARAALREVFGFEDFRGLQAEAIDAVLRGRDVLITMPTGSGKSLCYQIPALVLDGMVVVISPLIALMKDQVDALKARGVRAEAVNSSMSASARTRAMKKALAGELDLLYLTPERFRSRAFQEIEAQLPVARLAIDEAHCVSQWGHDFRPDYSRLGEYRQRLGDPPTIALTATATKRVAKDIATALRLKDPAVYRTGIERPNLFFGCTRVHVADEKLELLADRIRAIGGPGIVYSALIKDLEHLHGELARDGIHTLVYHGKLSDEERRAMQDRFMSSKDEVVLATNAFGMGVDKPDIRFVLHAQVPRTLEAWTQEVGRAGRDAKPSWCELFYFEEDLAIQQNFVEWANPTLEYLVGVYETLRAWGERVQVKDLDDLRDELLVKSRGDNRVSICLKWLEVLGVTEGSFEKHDLRVVQPLDTKELPKFLQTGKKREIDLASLLAMVRFANDGRRCRRAQLARYFGLKPPKGRCGACDNCTSAEEWGEEHMPTRKKGKGLKAPKQATAVEPERAEGSFQRGDWVRVGRLMGQVVKVEGKGRSQRLVVEGASDLKRRVVNPAKQQVELLED